MTDTGGTGSGDRSSERVEAVPDDPAVHPDGARVCVVAVVPETFAACVEGFYPCPASYARTDRAFEYLGLYRTAPVSAVTHVAPVTGRFGDDGERPGADRVASLVADRSETDVVEATVFELGDLVELADPVRSEGTPVRGAWYRTLGAVRGADTVGALADRPDPGR